VFKEAESFVFGQTLTKLTAVLEVVLPDFSAVATVVSVHYITKAKVAFGLCRPDPATNVLLD
jgi:hypothetical protein